MVENDKKIREKIITHNGHTFLRAGAGAGKSTLIAEKITKLISDGFNLDEIAAITFTNKSALDLKWKIEEKLIKAKNETISEEIKKHINEQITKIPESAISTIHSFCSRILFMYPIQAGIDPATKSLDDQKEKIFFKNFLDDYFFDLERNLKQNASKKSDSQKQNTEQLVIFWSNVLAENILYANSFSTSQRSEKSPLEVLQKLNNYSRELIELSQESFLLRSQEKVEELKQKWFEHIKNISARIYDSCICKNKSGNSIEQINDIIQKSETLAQAQEIFTGKLLPVSQSKSFEENKCEQNGLHSPRVAIFLLRLLIKILQDKLVSVDDSEYNIALGIGTKDESAKDEEKNLWNILSFAFTDNNGAEKKEEKILSEKNFDQEFLRYQFYIILKDFFEKYLEHKKQQSVIDFSDQLHYTLDFVKSAANRKKIQEKFKFLFVDEYQDTDPVQTEIFLYLSEMLNKDDENNKEQKNNLSLFRVGDQKQSIYRFRGADVSLYQEQLKEFTEKAKAEKENFLSERLQINFRSYKPITDFVNFVFGKNKSDAQNDKATSAVDTSPLLLQNYQDMFAFKNETNNSYVRVGLLGFDSKEDKEDTIKEKTEKQNNDKKSKSSEAKKTDEPKKIKSEQLRATEAKWICEKIKELQKNETKEKRSIALLFRSMQEKTLLPYLKELESNGITYFTHGRKFYEQAFPFDDFTILLRVLAFPLDEIALTGWLRSPVNGFTDQEIYNIRSAKLLTSLGRKNLPAERLAELNNKSLEKKLTQVSEQLFAFKETYDHFGLDDMLYAIFAEINFLHHCSYFKREDDFLQMFAAAKKMANVFAQEKDALRLFSQKVDELKGVVTDKDVLDIENIQENLGNEETGVHLMTIHAAKGLEFDAVFVPSFYSRSRSKVDTAKFLTEYQKKVEENKDTKKQFLFQLKGDFSLLKKPTPFDISKEEETEEKKRLAYVAFTRAKEHLFLFLPNKEIAERGENVVSKEIAKLKKYLDNAPELWQAEMLEHPQEKNKNKEELVNTSFHLKEKNFPTFFSEEKIATNGITFFSATSLLRDRKEAEKKDQKELEDNTEENQEELDLVESANDLSMADQKTEEQNILQSDFKNILWGERSMKKFNSRKKGILIHQLFEWLDLKDPKLSNELIETVLKSQNIDLQEKSDVVKELQLEETITIYKESELYKKLAVCEIVGKEVPFSHYFAQENKMASGYMDLILREKNNVYLIDYKTNNIGKHTDEHFFQIYKEPMSLYQEALEKYFKENFPQEKFSVSSYLYMTKNGNLIKME